MSRKLSWLLAAIAYLGPPLWAYFAIKAAQDAQMAAYGFIKCGTPMAMTTLSACKASGLLSLLATGFAIASFRSASRPLLKTRVLEIVAVSVPLVVAVVILASMLWA
jgi:hypothetical protein